MALCTVKWSTCIIYHSVLLNCTILSMDKFVCKIIGNTNALKFFTFRLNTWHYYNLAPPLAVPLVHSVVGYTGRPIRMHQEVSTWRLGNVPRSLHGLDVVTTSHFRRSNAISGIAHHVWHLSSVSNGFQCSV